MLQIYTNFVIYTKYQVILFCGMKKTCRQAASVTVPDWIHQHSVMFSRIIVNYIQMISAVRTRAQSKSFDKWLCLCSNNICTSTMS